MTRIRQTEVEPRSKIVATVGPASADLETLVELINHGVDVFRINTAHGKIPDFEAFTAKIGRAREITGFPVATLLDLAGPKIRLGQLIEDPLDVEPGDELEFIRGGQAQHPRQLTSSYQPLVDEVQVGDRIMLADGTITLSVADKRSDSFTCQVQTAGTIRSRQGINLPGVTLSVSALLPSDVENATWAARHEIDFISLSFVRSPREVLQLKKLLAELDSPALVIAKIEKREALESLEEIVEAADGIMVARGDLGVEIDVAETPVAQKRIIHMCRDKLKPVIVATQMLESMHHNRRPTRAEASDVANAILDGADACMLSGETAIGHYPIAAVDTMNRIMVHTERMLADQPQSAPKAIVDAQHLITSAVTLGAAEIATTIGAKLLVVASLSGNTAWVNSKQRKLIPTLGVSNRPATLRRMCLFWGIVPHFVESIEQSEQLYEVIAAWGQQHELLSAGDKVVMVTGTGIIENAYNQVVVHEVRPPLH